MNARALAFAALAAAALLPAGAAAQATDTTAVTVSVGKTAEPTTPRTDAAMPVVPHVRRSLNTITYEEVRTARGASDAFTLVHNLRPSWLRTPRGTTTINNPIDIAVFLNGVRMGSRDALTTIPMTIIRSVRFYTATEARQRFGGDTQAGAIEVTSP